MRANPAGNCAFSGRPRTFVLLNGSVAHKGLFHAGKLRSNCILRSLILLGISQQQRSQLSSQTQTGSSSEFSDPVRQVERIFQGLPAKP